MSMSVHALEASRKQEGGGTDEARMRPIQRDVKTFVWTRSRSKPHAGSESINLSIQL